MASVGDYVQVRDTKIRGEVVQKFQDDWCRVYTYSPDTGFHEFNDKELVVLVKGKNG